MEKKVQAHMPDEVYLNVSRLAAAAKMDISQALELCFNLGAPLFESIYVSDSSLPIKEKNETAEQFEARIRSAIRPVINYKELVKKREGSILIAYIRFLESYDGHPQRFFFRDPELGRIIATPETIGHLKRRSSPVYCKLASDVSFAEMQWVARWVSNVEALATGDRKGCFDALKWIMERDHGWLIKTDVKPDLDRLCDLLGVLRTDELK